VTKEARPAQRAAQTEMLSIESIIPDERYGR
jgi:hypothetical protein